MTPVLLSVLLASFVGSLHCAAMCGGLTAAYAAGSGQGRGRVSSHVAYHGCRLVAYAGAGAAAGALGQAIDGLGSSVGVAHVAAGVAGAAIIFVAGVLFLDGSGVAVFRARGAGRFSRWASHLISSVRARSPIWRAAALGLCSALLPCGWLYAFVLAAAGTGSSLEGAALMTAFWFGTVPALVGLAATVQGLARRLGHRVPIVAAITLSVVGLSTVWFRVSMPHASGSLTSQEPTGVVPEEAPCHGR